MPLQDAYRRSESFLCGTTAPEAATHDHETLPRTCAPEAAPEAATSELYRWRHSHDQETLHFLHVRKVKTPSSSQMHGQGVQLTPITECELQAVSSHRQSQQGPLCREGLCAGLGPIYNIR